MKKIFTIAVFIFLSHSTFIEGQTSFEISPNVDFVSRYIWRGFDIASTPSIQPSIGFAYHNFTLGFWGAYTFSNQESASDEIDIWLSYDIKLGNIIAAPIITDYYYPNSGSKLFNFDNENGAHLLETGLILSGENIPISVSAYYNFYNDPGNNTYFEIAYTAEVSDITFDSFIGAAGGSKKNSLFYNTENINVINVGLKATKYIKVSDALKLPVFISFIVNPRNEKAYLAAGFSL